MAKAKSGSAEPVARKTRGGGGGKAKKEKDPNAPKKNQSAYMIFCNEQRPIVKEENPDATFGEMGKLLGAKWKTLGEDEKKPYNTKAEADKERYAKESANYKSSGGGAAAAADDDDEE